jgi:limonene-1,2-epoxide hydrolase
MITIEDFKQAYLQLNSENLALLATIYEPHVVFEDPMHRIEGLEPLTDYFRRMYQNVTHIHFEFGRELKQDAGHMLTWDMHVAHAKLNGGGMVCVPGCSHLVFANKCIYHRDYFDLGALLYENIVGLGALIRLIKRRA